MVVGINHYDVFIDDHKVASGMTSSVAVILLRALMDEYYNDHALKFTIMYSEMEADYGDT